MEIKVSVRGLVEFLLRTGDIDNRKKSAPDDAMAEGSRIHRMIQKKMGSSYHAEVMLRYRRDCGEYDLVGLSIPIPLQLMRSRGRIGICLG